MYRLLILTAIAIAAFGCQRSVTPTPKMIEVQKEKEKTERILRTNFDINSENLSPNFSFNTPLETIHGLETLKPKLIKDTYETTVQYQERIGKLASTILYDAVSLSGGFAFKYYLKHPTGNYDADRQELTYDVRPNIDERSHSGSLLPIWSQSLDARGDTHFEAFEKIFREKHFKKLEFEENIYLSFKRKESNYSHFIFKIKKDSLSAKSLEGKLSIVFVGNILPPYLILGEKWPGADGDDKTFQVNKIIPFALKGIWLINEETGEVLTKLYKEGL